MHSPRTSAASYFVEVSGWDAHDDFFVETTTLEWNDETGKRARLRHALEPGAVLFIRLTDGAVGLSTFPVAYQAESVGPRDVRGLCEVNLVQLRPRGARPRCDALAQAVEAETK